MDKLNYSISMTLGGKLDVVGVIQAQVFPLMSQAVRAIAKHTAAEWQTSVLKAKLWSVEKDEYAKSITWSMTGDFSASIETDYKYAGDIETGRPARDLKRMLDTSQKVRRTKDGRRFLVIPMRENTPGNDAHAPAMPAGVHALAKAMAPSRVTGMSQRPAGEVTHLSPTTGMAPSKHQTPYLTSTSSRAAVMTAKRAYAWGDRLKAGAMKQAGMDAATIKRYAGMVKMDTSTPGGAKSSAFLKFRIMMEGSSGWIVSAKPGLFIAKKVAEDMAPKAEIAFAEAIKRTLKG